MWSISRRIASSVIVIVPTGPDLPETSRPGRVRQRLGLEVEASIGFNPIDRRCLFAKAPHISASNLLPMAFHDTERSVYRCKSATENNCTAVAAPETNGVQGRHIPYRAISGTRQRLWVLAGKGPFQLTGVLMDVQPFFSGPQ